MRLNHHLISSSNLSFPQVPLLVIRVGLEPTTPSLRGSCSNQLSYRTDHQISISQKFIFINGTSTLTHHITTKITPKIQHHNMVYHLAYSIARVSRITFTLIMPGYDIVASILFAISRANFNADKSSICFGSTITRISRPAEIA